MFAATPAASERLPCEPMRLREATDLGETLITTPEQTALDLAKRPDLGELPDQVRDAITTLLPRCDLDRIGDLAREQRASGALHAIRDHTGEVPNGR
ncbi:MAG: hypothetical protein ACRDO1_06625 [Nocardioidaceae bacterium]